MSRVYNFSAGPSCLPEEVLKECAAEMLDYNGSGQSVMEMSHRSSTYQAIIDHAESQIRKLMKVPENYKILFCREAVQHSLQWSQKTLESTQEKQLTFRLESGQKGGGRSKTSWNKS